MVTQADAVIAVHGKRADHAVLAPGCSVEMQKRIRGGEELAAGDATRRGPSKLPGQQGKGHGTLRSAISVSDFLRCLWNQGGPGASECAMNRRVPTAIR